MQIATTLAASLALLSLGNAASPQSASWLCIADDSTGFRYDKNQNKWLASQFDVDDKRYLITKQVDPASPYQVKSFDENRPIFVVCKNELTAATFLSCPSLGGDFKFNVKTLRFMFTYHVGYINPTPGLNDMVEGNDTPFIEIGRCSKL